MYKILLHTGPRTWKSVTIYILLGYVILPAYLIFLRFFLIYVGDVDAAKLKFTDAGFFSSITPFAIAYTIYAVAVVIDFALRNINAYIKTRLCCRRFMDFYIPLLAIATIPVLVYMVTWYGPSGPNIFQGAIVGIYLASVIASLFLLPVVLVGQVTIAICRHNNLLSRYPIAKNDTAANNGTTHGLDIKTAAKVCAVGIAKDMLRWYSISVLCYSVPVSAIISWWWIKYSLHPRISYNWWAEASATVAGPILWCGHIVVFVLSYLLFSIVMRRITAFSMTKDFTDHKNERINQ
ncbi:MAG: hypothetical protein ACRC2T_20335 [Thermoguttaceae bacterium]